jgi:hypothetical protein
MDLCPWLGTRTCQRRATPCQNRRSGRSITGRWPDATPEQEARLAVSSAVAEAAMRRVREIDPKWRPTPSISEGIEGEIARNDANLAEARARLAALRWSEPDPESLRECLMPAGQPIGVRNRGVGSNIRTVSDSEFSDLLARLASGSRPVLTPPEFKGLWFERPDGSVFSIRLSDQSGLTIDIVRSNEPDIRPGFKVHRK